MNQKGKKEKIYSYQGPGDEKIDNFMKDVQSTIHMFYNTVKKHGERPAQKFKVNGEYQTITYNQFAEKVEKSGNGFMSLEIKKGECISIMAHTSPEWDWVDYGGRAAGAIIGTIYPSSSDEEIVSIANDSEVKCLCVGTEDLLYRIKNLWTRIPSLKKVVILDVKYKSNRADVINLDDLMEIGNKFNTENPMAYEKIRKSLTQDDPASILYTSGTTGNLKGCLLTHKNILAATIAVIQVSIWGGRPFRCDDVIFSVLPLSHNWNRFDNHSSCICYGGLIGYAESPKTVMADLQQIKPTFLMMVPRIWSRVFNGVKAMISATPEGKEKFEWAMDVGRKILEQRMDENGVVNLIKDPVENLDPQTKADFLKADSEVFSIFRNAFGGNIDMAYSGGSLLQADLQINYWSMNFPLLDGWGLTETTSGISMIQPRCVRIGWLSPDFEGPNAEGKLAEDGEILVRGDAVIKEYFKKPEDTATSFTPDGWFKTGDIGEFDHGFLRIVDRKKNIIILDTGKNVSPAYVELKFANSSIIEQIVIIGDNRKYISALVIPSYDNIINLFKLKGIPFDESKPKFAVINGLDMCIDGGDELSIHPEVQKMVDAEIKAANEELSDHEAIKKYTILQHKLTEERGELTPTLKVKNRVVFKNHDEAIEELYK